jgi:hypothetical protein
MKTDQTYHPPITRKYYLHQVVKTHDLNTLLWAFPTKWNAHYEL